VVDELKMEGLQNTKAYLIYNALGVKVLEGILDENKSIRVKQLAKGTYFLALDSKEKIRFIKN
jgi:hypothetical protein